MEPNDVASLPVVARWSPNSSNAIPLAVFPNESQETRAGLQRGPTTPSPPHLPLLRPVAQLPGPPPRAASQALCRELEGQPVPLAWRTRRSSDGEATGDGLGEHAGQPPGLGASLVSSARTSAPRCPSPRRSATSHPLCRWRVVSQNAATELGAVGRRVKRSQVLLRADTQNCRHHRAD